MVDHDDEITRNLGDASRIGRSSDEASSNKESSPEDGDTGDAAGEASCRALKVVPREHYLFEGEIARGGMGRILAARDLWRSRKRW